MQQAGLAAESWVVKFTGQLPWRTLRLAGSEAAAALSCCASWEGRGGEAFADTQPAFVQIENLESFLTFASSQSCSGLRNPFPKWHDLGGRFCTSHIMKACAPPFPILHGMLS